MPESSLVARERVKALFRSPLAAVLLLRLLDLLARWWDRRSRYLLSRRHVTLGQPDEIDGHLVEGVMFSTEFLATLGRVEKRTLFSRPLLDLLGGNRFLRDELLVAAEICRRQGHNCIVTRWMPEDERYYVLRAGLNAMSSLFGPAFVHKNALIGSAAVCFKETWYCLTVMMPNRPEAGGGKSRRRVSSQEGFQKADENETCTFTDMSRSPRASLRFVLVNELELRRIADFDLSPPSWGFFNGRHAERHRMLLDLARNFQLQLARTLPVGSAMDPRNPFTNERVHSQKKEARIQRVASTPAMRGSITNSSAMGALAKQTYRPSAGDLVDSSRRFSASGANPGMRHQAEEEAEDEDGEGGGQGGGDGAAEENCFLRLHVPQFVGAGVGRTPAANRREVSSEPARRVSLQEQQHTGPAWTEWVHTS